MASYLSKDYLCSCMEKGLCAKYITPKFFSNKDNKQKVRPIYNNKFDSVVIDVNNKQISKQIPDHKILDAWV